METKSLLSAMKWEGLLWDCETKNKTYCFFISVFLWDKENKGWEKTYSLIIKTRWQP